MTQDTTLTYYETHADEYFQSTCLIDMSPACDRFLNYIPTSGSIIDLGCGSGRDLKYFHDKGCQAEGADSSRALCQKAARYTGLPISHVRLQEWKPTHTYHGIWCCASLLHLTPEEIFLFMRRAVQALLPGGVLFLSAKYGIKTGLDSQGRYFTNFSDTLIHEISARSPKLTLAERWYTKDGLGRADVKWVNLIYQKTAQPDIMTHQEDS